MSDDDHKQVLETLTDSVLLISRKATISDGLHPTTIATLNNLNQVLRALDCTDAEPAEAVLSNFTNERDLFEFDDLIQKREAYHTWHLWLSQRSDRDRTEDSRDIRRGVKGAEECASAYFLISTAYYLVKELEATQQPSEVQTVLKELKEGCTIWLNEAQRWAREDSDGQKLFPKEPEDTVTGV